MNDGNCIICKKHKDNLHIVYQNQFIAISHYVKYPEDSNNYFEVEVLNNYVTKQMFE